MKHIKVGQTVYYNTMPNDLKLEPLKITSFSVSNDQKTIWVNGIDEKGYKTFALYDSIYTTSRFRYLLNKIWWN